MKRTRLTAVLVVTAWMWSQGVAAQPTPPRGSPPRATQPTASASTQPPPPDDDTLFVLSEIFSDAQWNDMVVEATPAPEQTETGAPPTLVRQGEGAGGLQPLQRQSIDQDVLQQMIIDRARRLAMRAVADVIDDAAGPVAERQYMRDFVAAVIELLVDRTGMQNTLIERLVGVVVRALVADAVVRMRFPDDDALVRAREVPWTGRNAEDPEDVIRLRGYLIDLAYWSLGQTPLFARRGHLPPCPFAGEDNERHPYRPVCDYIEPPSRRASDDEDDEERRPMSGADEEAQTRRVATLVGTGELLSGISVSHELLTSFRPPTHLRLQAFVEALARRPQLGQFTQFSGRLWQQYAWLQSWARIWKEAQTLARAIHTLESEQTNVNQAVTRVKSAAVSLEDMLGRECTGVPQGFAEHFCGYAPRAPGPSRPPPGPPPGPPPRPGSPSRPPSGPPGPPTRPGGPPRSPSAPAMPGCENVPQNLRGWAGALKQAQMVENAAQEPIGRARLRKLCVPFRFSRAIDGLGAGGTEERALTRTLDRVAEAAAALSDAGSTVEMPRYVPNVADLPLRDVDALATLYGSVSDALDTLWRISGSSQLRWLRNTGGSGPEAFNYWRQLERARRAERGLVRLLRLMGALDAYVLEQHDIDTVGEVVAGLRRLGGGNGSPLIERLGPILPYVRADQPITIETMLLLLDQIPVEQIVVALGVADRPAAWCEDDEGDLPCWTQRILLVLREATDVHDTQVAIDANRLVKTLGAMGEDFRRRTEWRWYFHLTIGLGMMWSDLPGELSETGMRERRFVPFMGEQIGIGYASPSFWGDALGVRFGVFGSGFLYRVVLNSEESNAIMFGGFLAVDVYELLEFFVAPMVLLYPPAEGNTPPPSFAVTGGVQIPLGDYLSQL